MRLLTYFLLITFLSCRRVNPSTDSQQVFARGGEREVELGLYCRLIRAANLGQGNKIEQFFFSWSLLWTEMEQLQQ